MPTAAARPLPTTTTPSRHVYDAVVLGGQLGGALCAALLARRGYSVLLVEHDGMGPGYEHGGFLLPYAPFICPPLKALPILEEALNELGLTDSLKRNLRPHTPELQLALPRHRVDLHANPDRRLAELTREFEDDGARLHAALQTTATQHEASDPFFRLSPPLPPGGFLESWRLKRLARQHPGLEHGPKIAASHTAPAHLLQGLLPFLSYLDQPSSPLATTRPLSQVLQSPSYYPGGREGLRSLLEQRLLELGGDVLNRERSDTYVVEELSFEGSRVSGLKLVRAEPLYRAPVFIASTDAAELRRLIQARRRQRRLADALDDSSVKSVLFSVNLVLPERALPRGLGELLLLDTEDKELGPLLLQVLPARRAAGQAADPALRVVCATAVLSTSILELGEQHLQALAERMEAQLDALMPFTRPHRVLRSVAYLDARALRGGRLLPHPLYAFESSPALGVGGLPQRTPASNLLLANREVLPGLGLEGELLAGLRAARLAQEQLPKKAALQR